MGKCTRADIAELLGMMSIAYRNMKPISEEEKPLMIELWYSTLMEFSREQIITAFQSYRKEGHEFAPNDGQLFQIIMKTHHLVKNDELTEAEAWAKVRKAISNGYYGAEKEWNELPEICKKAVGDASNIRAWSQVTMDELETVVKSHFARGYRQAVESSDFVDTLEANTRASIPKNDNFIAIEEKKAYEPSQSGVPAPEGFMDIARAIIGA